MNIRQEISHLVYLGNLVQVSVNFINNTLYGINEAF